MFAFGRRNLFSGKTGFVRVARISCRNKVFLILLKAFALFSYIRYFLLGPGLELLLSYKLFYESPSAAVADRNYVKEVLSLGQGAFLASITAYTILPVLALRSALNGKRSNFRFGRIVYFRQHMLFRRGRSGQLWLSF